MLFGIQLRDELNSPSSFGGESIRTDTRIDTDALVVTSFAESRQELGLAAADLQNPLVSNSESIDQVGNQIIG